MKKLLYLILAFTLLTSNLFAGTLEIDWFETCNTDQNAQAAYVTDATYGSDVSGGKTYTESDYTDAPGSAAFDDNEATWWNKNAGAPGWVKVDWGLGNSATIGKLRIKPCHPTWDGAGCKDFTFQGSNDDSNWTTLLSTTAVDNYNWQEFTFQNTIAYRYYRINITNSYSSSGNIGFYEVEMMEQLSLQSYSESTIKTQGSYALKALAAITDSLNKTLTKTF